MGSHTSESCSVGLWLPPFLCDSRGLVLHCSFLSFHNQLVQTEAQEAPWDGHMDSGGAGRVALGILIPCSQTPSPQPVLTLPSHTSSVSIHFRASYKVSALCLGLWGGRRRLIVAAANCVPVSSAPVLGGGGSPGRLGRLPSRRSFLLLLSRSFPGRKAVSTHCFLVTKELVGLANIY